MDRPVRHSSAYHLMPRGVGEVVGCVASAHPSVVPGLAPKVHPLETNGKGEC